MPEVLIVGVGGFLGAAARYLLSGFVHRMLGTDFPSGTIIANVIGCFLLGGIMFMFQHHHVLSPHVRLFIAVGFIGAFTTFSAFGYETLDLIHSRELLLAATNVMGNVVLGILAVWLGYRLLEIAHR